MSINYRTRCILPYEVDFTVRRGSTAEGVFHPVHSSRPHRNSLQFVVPQAFTGPTSAHPNWSITVSTIFTAARARQTRRRAISGTFYRGGYSIPAWDCCLHGIQKPATICQPLTHATVEVLLPSEDGYLERCILTVSQKLILETNGTIFIFPMSYPIA